MEASNIHGWNMGELAMGWFTYATLKDPTLAPRESVMFGLPEHTPSHTALQRPGLHSDWAAHLAKAKPLALFPNMVALTVAPYFVVCRKMTFGDSNGDGFLPFLVPGFCSTFANALNHKKHTVTRVYVA